MWKMLRHPSVLPLLGVMMTENPCPLVTVSKWMDNGNINEFVKTHPDANRLKFVRFSFRSSPSSGVDVCAYCSLQTSPRD